MANNVDTDQKLHSVASALGLHCLLRYDCPNTQGYYGIVSLNSYEPLPHLMN